MVIFILDGLLPDFAGPIRDSGQYHIIYACLFFLFVVIGSITVMNMLTGMLVQVVQNIAEVEKEEMNLCWVKMELERVMDKVDANKDEQLNKDEVKALICDTEICKVFQDVGVDVVQLVEVAEFHIFKDRDYINFREFLDLVLQLRQAKSVCLRDIVHLQQYIANELAMVEERLLDAWESQASFADWEQQQQQERAQICPSCRAHNQSTAD